MNFDISSDSDDDLPLLERAAKKAFGERTMSKNVETKVKVKNVVGSLKRSPKKKKVVLSHAFSDSDSDGPISPPKHVRKERKVELTPPPPALDDNLPDTEPLVDSDDGQAETEPLSDTDGLPAADSLRQNTGSRSYSGGRSSNKENRAFM